MTRERTSTTGTGTARPARTAGTPARGRCARHGGFDGRATSVTCRPGPKKPGSLPRPQRRRQRSSVWRLSSAASARARLRAASPVSLSMTPQPVRLTGRRATSRKRPLRGRVSGRADATVCLACPQAPFADIRGRCYMAGADPVLSRIVTRATNAGSQQIRHRSSDGLSGAGWRSRAYASSGPPLLARPAAMRSRTSARCIRSM